MSAAVNHRPLLPIVACVIGAHMALILGALFLAPSHPPIIQPKAKLVVRTVTLEPKTQVKREAKSPSLTPKKITAPPPPAPAATMAEPPPELPVPAEPEVISASTAEEAPPEPVAPSSPKPPTPAVKPASQAKAKEKPKLIKKTAPKPTAKPSATPALKTPAKPVAKTPAPKLAPKPAKPTSKKEAPKTTAKASPQTTPKATLKADPKVAAAKKKQQELLAQAQGALSKINGADKGGKSTSGSSLSQLKLPSQIGSLAIESLHFDEPSSSLSVREKGYRDELASRLKLLLKLPEYGLVKLKLTLARSGKVSQVTLLSSESTSNRTYIQKTLPTLTFPAFGDNFAGETSHTFQITLSSD